jgi:protein arginine kinase activator
MKCQKCPKAATLHITEIVTEEHIEELHLCEECAHKYLYEPQSSSSAIKQEPLVEAPDLLGLDQECELCGIKFVDFRNSGRLGCPHDYEEFHADLVPLLENIHGETRHCGKTPRRLPHSKQTQTELIQLRKQLLHAINEEAYEEAARLRDRIRQLEES